MRPTFLNEIVKLCFLFYLETLLTLHLSCTGSWPIYLLVVSCIMVLVTLVGILLGARKVVKTMIERASVMMPVSQKVTLQRDTSLESHFCVCCEIFSFLSMLLRMITVDYVCFIHMHAYTHRHAYIYATCMEMYVSNIIVAE